VCVSTLKQWYCYRCILHLGLHAWVKDVSWDSRLAEEPLPIIYFLLWIGPCMACVFLFDTTSVLLNMNPAFMVMAWPLYGLRLVYYEPSVYYLLLGSVNYCLAIDYYVVTICCVFCLGLHACAWFYYGIIV